MLTWFTSHLLTTMKMSLTSNTNAADKLSTNAGWRETSRFVIASVSGLKSRKLNKIKISNLIHVYHTHLYYYCHYLTSINITYKTHFINKYKTTFKPKKSYLPFYVFFYMCTKKKKLRFEAIQFLFSNWEKPFLYVDGEFLFDQMLNHSLGQLIPSLLPTFMV